MAGKSFKRAAATEDVWFGLPGPDGDEVRFDCLPVLPAGIILDFGTIMGGDDESEEQGMTKIAGGLDNFFRNAIVDEQFAQFQDMIHDKRCGIGLGMLSDVAAFLAEEYSGGRPTGAPSAPTSLKTESGNGSTAGALPVVQTYSRSKPPVPIH